MGSKSNHVTWPVHPLPTLALSPPLFWRHLLPTLLGLLPTPLSLYSELSRDSDVDRATRVALLFSLFSCFFSLSSLSLTSSTPYAARPTALYSPLVAYTFSSTLHICSALHTALTQKEKALGWGRGPVACRKRESVYHRAYTSLNISSSLLRCRQMAAPHFNLGCRRSNISLSLARVQSPPVYFSLR